MFVALKASDFCCFGSIELPLAKQGLVWIGGKNEDTSAAASNGSGKSTLFKALTWGLYGETIDGETGDKVIRHGAKEACVTVDLEHGWTIERVRKKGTTRLQLLQHGEPTHEDKKALQEKIIRIVGMDFRTFKNTVLYGQGDSARFADPATKDVDRKDILHRLLRTEALRDCYELALARLKDVKTTVATSTVAHASAQAVYETAGRLYKETSDRMAAWDSTRATRAASAKDEALALRDQAKELLAGAHDVEGLREQIKTTQASVDAAEHAFDVRGKAEVNANIMNSRRVSALANYDNAAREQAGIDSQLARLSGGRCPVCTSPLDGEHPKEHVATLESRHAELDAVAEVYRQEAKEALERQNQYRGIASKANERVARLPALRHSLAQLQAKLHAAETVTERARLVAERARQKLSECRAIAAEENPHAAAAALRSKEMSTADHLLTKRSHEKYAATQQVGPLEYWVKGFSGQGVPSHILDAVMPYLSDRANHYLETLTDGDITMEFSTQRELKSAKGEYRDEIDITWTIEGIDNYPPSGGQQRKMEIATDLALMDLAEAHDGMGLELFIADEILDGLDVEGTDRVIKLLLELRARRGSIFVVSHHPAMTEAFERAFLVTKRDGVSTLESSK